MTEAGRGPASAWSLLRKLHSRQGCECGRLAGAGDEEEDAKRSRGEVKAGSGSKIFDGKIGATGGFQEPCV